MADRVTLQPGRVVLLAPHHDDECLFSAFLALEHQPDLIVCTRGEVQGDRGAPITHDQRVAETDAAWSILAPGRDWVQWQFSDNEARTDWLQLGSAVHRLAAEYDRVIAPAPETLGYDGHAHHNYVGNAALKSFGEARTIQYLTYTRVNGRSTWGQKVEIKHPDWIIAKLRALACYTSQIHEPTTRPWFLGELTEWWA